MILTSLTAGLFFTYICVFITFMFKSNGDFNPDDVAQTVNVDGPADDFPTSLVVGTIAAAFLGPVALLPALGWAAAKHINTDNDPKSWTFVKGRPSGRRSA